MENVQYLGELTDDEDFFELYQLVQHPRVRENHFTKCRDVEFKERFRLSKEVVQFVTEEVSEIISSQTERYKIFFVRHCQNLRIFSYVNGF
jgi:hypothetical protein